MDGFKKHLYKPMDYKTRMGYEVVLWGNQRHFEVIEFIPSTNIKLLHVSVTVPGGTVSKTEALPLELTY